MLEIDKRGALAVPIALVIVFLIAFLAVWLVSSAIAQRHDRTAKERRSLEVADQKQVHIRRTLDSLTEWQRQFVLRFITERRTQSPDFEVGEYRAIWDSEMEVLVEKRVIRRHRRAGVYEIEPVYHDYLLDNWDPNDGTLR
jgi:hypothetical protein